MTRRAAPVIVDSTMGQANPHPVEVDTPYRWRKTPGWRPENVQFRETRRPGPPPGTRNTPEARAERFAIYCAAREAGAGVPEAGKAAGIAKETARRYETDRRALTEKSTP